ncbi:MAG: tRNA epoxyqueuosine(34) reductase QueG [Burkholderiales bacterium]|nr:tRNA epoxyqueuosine(34) reductase QueG [Burkholderiales bacterium]
MDGVGQVGHQIDAQALWRQLQGWARELGFSQIGVASPDLSSAEPGLQAWLEAGFHGGMGYMAAHGLRRARPAELVPGTLSVISARMDYLPREAAAAGGSGAGADWIAAEAAAQADPRRAVISIYARGRDYHKVLRRRLQMLAERLAAAVGPLGHRVFTDSAPVLEVEIAARAGLAWRGKHTLALAREGGSMFFIGEVYVDIALPPTAPVEAHCGSCSACIDACPTRAIVAPYRLDARRCISYLTIEHDGSMPLELREAIGNRIYGCDDCQLSCPWNKYAQRSALPDFDVRDGLDAATLLELWRWDEAEFLRRTEGSAIRRIGIARWRRNLAVALGNAWRASADADIAQALAAALPAADALLREHIEWALAQRPSQVPA